MLPEADSPFSGGRIWGRVVAKNTVYTLWIGTNDLGQDGLLGREASDSKKKNNVDPTSTVNDYLKCVWDAINQIYNAGARNFVLFKLVPLEKALLYANWESKDRLSADVNNVNR
ncbi:hypothetical protein J3459_015371 [Metarhizium acridum]|uniref:uncharacterized protein n=1 Tax=Metarhizium acridum TaxID=92637 RepID=UPI001C6AAC5C|nr:hypothetical protein J3459_015371 [Metarhizium acridum]KAG8414063.1 hypothetical protein J3458_011716 [Metarhizium acridum]